MLSIARRQYTEAVFGHHRFVRIRLERVDVNRVARFVMLVARVVEPAIPSRVAFVVSTVVRPLRSPTHEAEPR